MDSNQLKTINGSLNKRALKNILAELKDQNIIHICLKDYKDGYKEYQDSNQFFAPYLIEFKNGEAWLIFSSTSIRNDRMNNQQWNSYHLKRINPSIKKSYLVIPDDIVENVKELKQAQAYNDKIFNHKMYSEIDAVLTHSQLETEIVNHSEFINKKIVKRPYDTIDMEIGESKEDPLDFNNTISVF